MFVASVLHQFIQHQDVADRLPRVLFLLCALAVYPKANAVTVVVYRNAITIVKKAIELDQAQEYEKAYDQYYNALNYFLLAIKCTTLYPPTNPKAHSPRRIGEKNAKSKEVIRAKAGEYMERAEKLKEYLSEDKSKGNKKTAVGANGKDTKSGGGKSKYVGTSILHH